MGLRDKLKTDLQKIDVNMFNLGLNEVDEFDYYSTGFANVDWILGGGLGRGDFIEVYGEEGSGKTTFALQVVGNFLKVYKDKVVLYVDQEFALDMNWVKRQVGDGINRLEIIQPAFMESMGDAIKMVLEKDYVSMIVIDTLMASMPKSIFIDDSHQMGARAAAEGRLLMQLNPIVKRKKIPILVLNQMRIRTKGGNVFFKDVGGGNAKRYFMNEKIFFHAPSDKSVDGFATAIETKRNKHKVPFLKTDLVFKAGEGFDRGHSLIRAGMLKGEITVGGGWYYYKDKKYRKVDLIEELKKGKK